MNEFEIIQHFFNKKSDVIVGIGDDAAIVHIPQEFELAITVDTLVENIHFLPSMPPHALGFKSLAVNLSDLAAMGATPKWITLALTMPEYHSSWLEEFSRGLFELANRFGVQLIGGDLTRGPLTITIQALGWVPEHRFIRRNQAKVGDWIYVTHSLGGASAALKKLLEPHHTLTPDNLKPLYYPEPQIAIGQKLQSIAHAAIDISDGLIADLHHILEQSQVGACIEVDKIPLSPLLKNMSLDQALPFALNGGEDYELCFTLSENKIAFIDFECTAIGKITASKELDLRFTHGEKYHLITDGFKHF